MHKEGILDNTMDTFFIRVYGVRHLVRTIYVNENPLSSKPHPVERLY